ncbi:MAG TPA: hypothetical protein PLL20_18210 [Phycisphaerae bacterium]|nr:hypothetical protein [Phycisphaerae bacterium]HRR85290.1 hypothetical protein [Phycisphaerae bacterium]
MSRHQPRNIDRLKLKHSFVLALTIGLLCVGGCDRDQPSPAVPSPDSRPVTAPQATTDIDTTPAVKPPHGGRLLTMPDKQGYIEWVVDAGRLYVLDAAGGPAKAVENVVLTIPSDTGPQQFALIPCGDEAFDGACWTHSAPQLRDEHASAVLRFQFEGGPVRILISEKPPTAPIEDPLPRPTEKLPNQ